MKTFSLNFLLLWISFQSSVFPSEALSLLRTRPRIESELGCSPTLSLFFGNGFYFDPLGLADDENFARYREAELKHGRVAMLATVGMVLPNILVEVANKIDFIDFSPVPSGLNAFRELDLVVWAQIVVTCGFLETLVFYQRDKKDMPGDYGTGYFGLRDKGRHER